MTQKENVPKRKIWHFALVIILLYFGYKACDSPSSEQGNDGVSSEQIKKPEEMQSEAYITAQIFMEKQLKSPKSAEFPSFDYKFYASNDTYQFIIKSYVDAQNSFGAQLRTYYLVEMKWNGKDWADINNWELIDLATDENEF